jgi:ribosomal protein L37AE/L43A
MSDLTNIEKVGGCPFCGETPTVKRLRGGGYKHLVACTSKACPATPAVTGATRADAIRRWNTRKANTQDVLDDMKTICQSCGATVAIHDIMTATQAARVLARRAAAAPSPARQAASRANGRKGGRPRRRPTTGAEGGAVDNERRNGEL